MVKLELLKFGYKLSRQNLSSPIENLMNQKGGKKTHRYLTCNKAIPNIQPHKCAQFNISFLCKGVSLLSGAKDNIKGVKSIRVCIKEFKREIILKY